MSGNCCLYIFVNIYMDVQCLDERGNTFLDPRGKVLVYKCFSKVLIEVDCCDYPK